MVHDRGIKGGKVPERSGKTMKIGEAAEATGLSVSNIRFYERKGLLCPKRREESQYREYSPEDVRRLKEIMLLRKLGISIESIFLLYEGQAEYAGLLKRQEEKLLEEMEELKGSVELCRLLETEGPLFGLDVDHWLAYVHQEEENGKKFASAEELLEDLAQFSKFSSFRGDPYIGKFFRRRYTAWMLAVLTVVLFLLAAVSSVLSGGGILGKAAIIFWLLYLLGFFLDFFWFRRKRRRETHAETGRAEEQAGSKEKKLP